ncbi:MAG: RdgB/HAM1 family non-canonical purine NTP pyrophosphatase [Flavobacteriales bacterium]|nr:RdgB/HAM1 family non-canonical purine NTP pyrophosphatase [Flavobacteriales bacterium]
MTKLVFASNNPNKLSEIRALTAAYGLDVLSLEDVGFREEIDETEQTLEGNSRLKAERVHRFCGLNVFSDDTGLEVYSLNMAPGVYSARYAGEPPNDERNIGKLLEALKSTPERNARFRTVVTLIFQGETYQFEGIVEGMISSLPAGTKGFGYDPVFIPQGYDRTFAQMDLTEKNKISHRKRATEKALAYLLEKLSV